MRNKTIFTDIGGVLLTNGWDRKARQRAAEKFSLDLAEMEERHHLTFDTYEIGRLSLDEYLKRTVFYGPRSCTMQDFKKFMYEQSERLPDMLELLAGIKAKCGVKVVAISNEGRELADHRVHAFNLSSVIDSFVVSGYVYTRKPDASIFNLALDISQSRPADSIYLDDRALFVEVAGTLGLKGIHHVDFETTIHQLAEFGLTL